MVRAARLIGCFLCSMAAGRVGAEPTTLTMDDAVRLAQDNNPELRELLPTVEAAEARLGGAGLLLQHNPTLAVEAGSRARALEYSLQILQQVEVAGQRGLRIDAATATRDATNARVRALRVHVTARVRESFGRVLAAEERARLATDTEVIARQGVDAVEERLRAGAVALLELNTARVELGRATRVRADAERQRAEAMAALRLLLGVDPAEPFRLQGTLRTDTSPGDAASAIAQALANRSELEEARRALDAAHAEARLAARGWIPSPRLGASYRYEQDTDTNVVLGVVQLDLPVFNRDTAARGVTAARVGQLAAALTATERRISLEVQTALDRVRAARAAAQGYAGDVLEAMEQNMDLVTSSYRAGKIELLDLIVIRRQAVEARREYIDVLEELNAAQAQLYAAIGRAE
jgi:cobalt-zinc-cadmium efflux system outer membrane protein